MEIDGLDQMAVRYCDGDEEALNRLFTTSHAFVYSTAFGILRDANDAEDAAQVATLKAWRSYREFHENCRYATWLRRIVTNCCLDILRARKRGIERETNLCDQESEDLWDRIADRSPISMEDRIALRQTIEELPDILRVPLILHYIEGFTCQEISERMNLDAEAVRSRLRRALTLLKKRWTDEL